MALYVWQKTHVQYDYQLFVRVFKIPSPLKNIRKYYVGMYQEEKKEYLFMCWSKTPPAVVLKSNLQS